jgi:predicted RNA-binding protein with PUA-like domain
MMMKETYSKTMLNLWKNKHQFWLLKTEPETFSLQHLLQSPHRTTSWEGVRNYQARNYLRQMKVGDPCFFYHSSCAVPSIVAIVNVVRDGYDDSSSWDPQSPYYDSRSSAEKPRWTTVDVQHVASAEKPLSLSHLKTYSELKGMLLLQKGQRLSVQPVSPTHAFFLCSSMFPSL